ncbi:MULTISPECIES: DinB family protein [Niastella]|uniref:DinB family protein n=1 Tax=Niastella soli TaxID=2821487 RepID=A0ABS3YZY3_9BACT|nr:DinB family protein [Niastella soli]MBO9203479.1 DinB family protein [Niastella soli]
MNQITFLAKQTESAYAWANKLLLSIPHQKWDTTPDIMESNITWQTGHLIVSFYYHSIMVIVGHQKEVLQQVSLKEYGQLFTTAAPVNAKGKFNPEQLSDHLLFMQQRSLEVIQSLSPADLEAALEPVQPAHPIAKNKGEALEWNIQHTLWHCGQISMLKRVVDKRLDFGLLAG